MPAGRSLRAARGLAVAALLVGLVGCGNSDVSRSGPGAGTSPTGSPGPTGSPTFTPTFTPTPPPPELPRGGRTIFPSFTVVGFYGTVQGRGDLGVLGQDTPARQAAVLEQVAAQYVAPGGRPVLPAFELITTIAQGGPGPEGTYSKGLSDGDVQAYLDAARAAKAYLVLDLQPGTARFVDQARRYERFLREPDVGLGLDPEWKLQPGQLPRGQIGSTTAAEINEVSAYLQQLVTAGDLPQKLFVVHQFKTTMLPDRAAVATQPGLATVLHVDGFGSQQVKKRVYATLSLKQGPWHNGLKLFFDEDQPMLAPAEAMALVPRPDLITYQ